MTKRYEVWVEGDFMYGSCDELKKAISMAHTAYEKHDATYVDVVDRYTNKLNHVVYTANTN